MTFSTAQWRVSLLAASGVLVLLALSAASPVASSAGTSAAAGWKAKSLGYGYAYDINERGQIVGAGVDFGEASLLWQNGRPRELSWGGGDANSASAINDDSEIVGGSWEDDHDQFALLWRRNGVVRLPPLRKGYWSDADDINNSGQIVGHSGSQPTVWEKGRPRALPGGRGGASAINDAGVIVGILGKRLVLWENGKLRQLATLRGQWSYWENVDLNNLGQVVGSRWTNDFNTSRGFLWQKGKMVDLGTGFLPEAINDRGLIVGSCREHPCVWQRGKLTRLDDLGHSDATATAINERQQIVGYGYEGGGDLRPLGVALRWTFKPLGTERSELAAVALELLLLGGDDVLRRILVNRSFASMPSARAISFFSRSFSRSTLPSCVTWPGLTTASKMRCSSSESSIRTWLRR